MKNRLQRSVRWMGDSRDVVRGLPETVRWAFGRALYKAQVGRRHEIASPLKGHLGGVLKLAVAERGNAYRLYYTLKYSGYVDVLFAHMKKSKQGIGLPGREERLIARRFGARVADCSSDTEEFR